MPKNTKGEVKLSHAGHGRWNVEIIGQTGAPRSPPAARRSLPSG